MIYKCIPWLGGSQYKLMVPTSTTRHPLQSPEPNPAPKEPKVQRAVVSSVCYVYLFFFSKFILEKKFHSILKKNINRTNNYNIN